jgi:hypothetical protein
MGRNAWRVLAGVLGALILSACEGYPDAPPNMPPPLRPAEQMGTPGVLRSDMLVVAGQPVVAAGEVALHSSLISIPYRYKYTAVLTEDVMGHSFTVRGVQAPKGAPGFYAGTFEGGRYANGPKDMWCFLPKAMGKKPDEVCFFRMLPGVAAIAPTAASANQYMWYSFEPKTGSFNMVYTPIFERREVEIPADLKLEYRFYGWEGTKAKLVEFAVGGWVHMYELHRAPDGSAQLKTIAGVLRVSPGSGDPNSATATLTPLP